MKLLPATTPCKADNFTIKFCRQYQNVECSRERCKNENPSHNLPILTLNQNNDGVEIDVANYHNEEYSALLEDSQMKNSK